MKKRILTLFVLVATLVSCSSVQQGLSSTYNLMNCEYNYKSISNLSISGINVSNGLSLTAIPTITSLLSGNASSIPLNLTVNVDIKNPNQSAAAMQGLQYILSIDDVQFTTGSINQAVNIAAGQTQTMPITIGVDIASLMKGDTKNAATEAVKNLVGMGTKQSNVTLQLKPSFLIGNTTIPSPMYIPVSFSFGGK